MGLRVLLVTGRERGELDPYLRALGPLDGLVAENGAVIEVPIGAPPTVFGRRIALSVRRAVRGVPRLRARLGQVTVSVARGDGPRLRRAIAGLPVRIVANVDRLMVLPVGIDKASGTRRALRRLGVARAGYAAIGDAENDLPLLEGAALSGAVANAEPRLRNVADYVCRQRYDRGVLEFVRGPLAESVHREAPATAA
jgi:hydroxymethylpyrimidine pyrophosphatase-like HAD family hydrolase